MTASNSDRPSPFGIHYDEKVYFFIEGANLYAVSRAVDLNIDYKRLLEHFQNKSRFVRANYYTAIVEDQEFNSIRPLIDFLDYNGYRVVTKAAKEHTDSMGRRRVKGNVDVEMTVDMIEAAKHAEHIVLFSSDGDFVAAVDAVQRLGVRVTVVSDKTMCADELRRKADAFVDLNSVSALIGKPNEDRSATPRTVPTGTLRARPSVATA
ncbi:MAG: NYN domain-containing protein [Verrucomicrobiaceae bacterium]|nr:MAG: NYN domain-containing protein [Verrucomicrobiaceae bacterium]